MGVGFIGAGLIVFKESKVRGLTTAAGLWVAAAIGMSVGYRLFSIAIFTTILTIAIFVLLWFIEMRFVKKIAQRTEVKDEQSL